MQQKKAIANQTIDGLSSSQAAAFLPYTGRLFLSFFVLGLLNNNGYVLLGASAQIMAGYFGHKDLMGIFQFCLSGISLLVRVFNTKFLLQFRHKSKIVWVVAAWCIGFAGYAGAVLISNKDLGFAVALACTIIIGCHTSIGSMTIVGFMKALPPKSISGYSSGTGFAGISGTTMNLGARMVGMNFNILCLLMIPTYVLYIVSFFWVVKLKAIIDLQHPVNQREEKDPLNMVADETQNDNPAYIESLQNPPNREENQILVIEHRIENEEAKINTGLSWESLRTGLKLVGMDIFNLTIVYYLEYLCTTSFAERANPKPSPNDPDVDFFTANGFLLLQVSYQVGVFISRSSFVLFKFPWVSFLSFLQFINCVIFATVAYWRWLNIKLQIPLMLWVGLMGGCSFVNCMYNILSNPKLKKKDKETIINAAAFFNDLGILSAAVSALVISKWVIPQ